MKPIQLVTSRAAALLALAIATIGAATTTRAAELPLSIAGLHLCCGGCTSAVQKALAGCEGVASIAVSQDEGGATFTASDERARDAALKAVAAAGFAGRVRCGDQDLPFPMEPLDDEATSHRVVFQNVHLCCKGCVRAVVKAYDDFPAVEAVDCDIKKRTVTLTGDKINLVAARRKLTGAGYYGVIAK